MQVKKQYFQKYLSSMAIEQLTDEYQEKGYVVSKQQLGAYEPDLLLTKNQETIVIEIETGQWAADKKERILQLSDYVRNRPNYKMLLVFATPPKPKNLGIEAIDDLILTVFSKEMPSELRDLATNTRIEEIESIAINTINVKNDKILVSGDGIVCVELHFDKGTNDKLEQYERFPFEFELILNYNDTLKVTKVSKLKVDTSSFYKDKQNA